MRRHIIFLSVTVLLIVGTFIATLVSDSRPQLGLDLQGGISITLFPLQGSDLSKLSTAADIIRNRVDGLGIAEPDVSVQGGTIVIDLPGAKNTKQAEDLVGKTAELRFRQVIGQIPYSSSATPPSTTTVPGNVKGTTTTVKGGTPTTAKGTPATTAPSSSTTKKSLKSRAINVQPISAVRRDAGPATSAPTATSPPTTAKNTTGTTAKGSTPTTAPATQSSQTCEDGKLVTPPEQNTTAAKQVILPEHVKAGQTPQVCYVLGPTLLTGQAVSSAQAVVDAQNASWIVNVHFKNNDFVTKVAQPYVGQQVAITLDQEVMSAPTINQGITGQDVTISGNFSSHDASQLALVLRYGSLPLQFDQRQQTVESVSPTLGRDQLHAGIVAGLIGLALVALYMILFYRLLGLVVWTGIALTGMTFFTLITYLSSHQGLTLTLAGVTGIIVSVGVTVDSYVVYFERLKDEVRTGKTVRSSLDSGFRRAFRTIIAADLVSIIVAVTLYFFATGSVRGFAYFLALSTILDLILAYFFMYPAVSLLARNPKLVQLPGVGIAAGLDVPGVRA
jgi:preprotein translocase subunit SecD